MMLRWVVILSLLLVCSGQSYVSAESSEIPFLVGTRAGNSVGHFAEGGFINETTFAYEFVVLEQERRGFTGILYESGIHGNLTYGFSGVIGHDMTTLYVADHEKG